MIGGTKAFYHLTAMILPTRVDGSEECIVVHRVLESSHISLNVRYT
jgi:hypothetical protein